MAPLARGRHDGLVVDAEDNDDGTVSLEVALTSGPEKGSVVRVRGGHLGGDAMSLLGLPVVLDVDGESVRVRVERG